MKKALVLLSGGQDSTTCLFWAKQTFASVEAIGFDYAQKHRVELKQANIIANIAMCDYRIFDVRGLLGASSLTEHDADHNQPHRNNPHLPASFTAGRNALFLTVAASYAHERGISDIVTGVCQTDYSGYPDCRREFIDAQERALSLAMEREFKIHTPLMNLTKAETWKLANDIGCLETVRLHTMTDYNGDMTYNEWGLGKNDNPASALRVKGYFEAKEKGWI